MCSFSPFFSSSTSASTDVFSQNAASKYFYLFQDWTHFRTSEQLADLRSWDYIMSMSAVLCNRAEGLNFQILTNLNIKANGRERWQSWLRRKKVFFFKLEPLELASWWQSYEKLLEKDRLNWIWKNYSNQIEISNRQVWKCFLCLAVSLFFFFKGIFQILMLVRFRRKNKEYTAVMLERERKTTEIWKQNHTRASGGVQKLETVAWEKTFEKEDSEEEKR